jgi:hypothetical protein
MLSTRVVGALSGALAASLQPKLVLGKLRSDAGRQPNPGDGSPGLNV